MKITQLMAAAAITLLSVTSGHASTAASGKITAGTTFDTNNAFQFTNDSTAGEFITSLTWDLTPIGGFFDTTNVAPGLSSSGLQQSGSSSNVGAIFPTNAFQNGLSALTIMFAANSFASGEKFIFGVDTDFFNCIDCAGINGNGFVGATVSALFSNGQTRYGTYMLTNEAGFGSKVDITSVTSAVPEPETYAMMLAGLGLVGAIARRRKQRQNA